MDVKDFYFDLPQELIAQDPLEDRSSSRLLVLDKKTGKTQHRIFKDIVEYLRPGDCLVINDTKVIPARLFGVKKDTGAKIYATYYTTRKDNAWAKANPDEVQQCYIMTPFYTAAGRRIY